MINANNSNSIQITPTKTKLSNSVIESSLTKKKKKTENDTSNTRLGQSDKSTSKSLSTSDVNAEMQIKKEIPKSPKNNKITRNKTVALGESNNKNSVKFKKDFVNTVVVESFKKYNVDMSYNEAEPDESTKCRCFIF